MKGQTVYMLRWEWNNEPHLEPFTTQKKAEARLAQAIRQCMRESDKEDLTPSSKRLIREGFQVSVEEGAARMVQLTWMGPGVFLYDIVAAEVK